MEPIFVKDRLRLLLEHFGAVDDPREPARVCYPLPEVLFLVTCASIVGCDDYDEIADWGAHHLHLVRALDPGTGRPSPPQPLGHRSHALG
ncbi:MAG TPA: transposase family protein [Azospirillaceae bacterium]|nr:transposase family protein [Azospirillaceae bacterium]